MNNKKAKESQPTYRAIQLAILAELRKQTMLLEGLGKQGHAVERIAATQCAIPSVAPDAPDTFAPTFEVAPSATGYAANITMREGAVVYMVNATGPRSNAVKLSPAGIAQVLLAPLVELPHQANGLIPKSVLERELQRREVLQDKSPGTS